MLLRNSYGMVSFLIITDVYTFTVVKKYSEKQGKASFNIQDSDYI